MQKNICLLAVLACVACGGPEGDASDPWQMSADLPMADALAHQALTGFEIKSAAYDVTETGSTRTFTLYVSDQNDVCHDVLKGLKHKGERRLGMVGMSSGTTPLTTRFELTPGRSVPGQAAAMLAVPVFYELDGRCKNMAPSILSGAMTVLDIASKKAGIAYSLKSMQARRDPLLGAATASFCAGLHRVRPNGGYGGCLD